ncbi:MAG: 3'-5' exonuclease domain-containing protein 2 [Bacteroidaceae bacterium]|nr:3'-5' exonuclease domain-containing protein 2 [Bacteroidaceae bacterium]MCF0243778.1 3'-5' exonuclease domain-containing protein 2 [Bacteroidaceae bacterium]
MLKTIYNKFDKQKITDLPKVAFPGRIITIFSEGEAERAVRFLLTQPILGFDTETRPSFTRGHSNKVALLQVSTPDICFLFRLNFIGITPAIKTLLEDTTVLKVGLSLKDDILMLQHREQFTPGYFYDLQHHVKEIGIEDLSLQKLYANIFGMKMSKTQRLSNWEASVLTNAQKIYAATDAWSCIMLYDELNRLKQTGEYELKMVEEE